MIMKKILGIITMLCLGLSLSACTSKVELKLKNKSLDVEYGSQIDKNVSTYLDNDKDVLKEVKLSGIPDNEKDKDYPSVGEYELTLTYKDDTKNAQKVKVNVKDTNAPKFEDVKDKYTLDYGKKLSTDDFKATDLSKVTITLEDKDVNYKKAGTYKATIIAKDESNNETKKEIEVVVKEEEKKEVSQSSSTSTSNKTSSSNKSTTSKSSSSSQSTSSSSNTSSSASNSASSTSNNANPATCNHGGYQPLVGGWYSTDAEIHNFYVNYQEEQLYTYGKDIGCTYGVYWCPYCNKMCINCLE